MHRYGLIGVLGAVLGLVMAVAFWEHEGTYDLSVVFLVLTVLLVPATLLLGRDAGRRRVEDRQGRDDVPLSGASGTSGSGALVVSRPAGWYQDRLRRYEVLVDGRVAGRLRRGEDLRLDVPAGRHSVQARIDWTGSPPVEVDVPPAGSVTVTVTPDDPVRGLFSSDRYLRVRVRRTG
ncbi:hypothetical protein [Geodermatophilus sp. DSM 45219]|uniref:hypothetical protein n=1 Tax=Geodermatophilus sp. DSM 45219 TaxID=1881103 RepID=UPI0008922E0F|nr:hypothetical protein [Geodermatophilus sp. DSM 45219]SDO22397.1 hypothetical protein SAMN05428965_3276 [Geodermatophilus sp. DSM 45219]